MKIRGFRIELGEIESVLHRHGDVSQAVVMAREDEPGNKKLVAYIVPGEFTPSSAELREFLLENLPNYMVPFFFLYVDKIPLTPNGKIDRKALLLSNIYINKNEKFIEPFNHIQLSLLKIWQQVLKIEEISINHNFFEIGGNSVLAIKVVTYIKQFLYKKISVADVFKNTTIYSLSILLKSSSKKPFNSPIIPIREGNEPTNNLAEQTLRRIVIWRKTSFGTQSPRGTLYLERIMTVVASCKLQKRNVLDFVTDAIKSHLSGLKPPLLPLHKPQSVLSLAA